MTGLQVSCCAQIRLYSLLKWWLYKDHKQKSINSFVNKKQERMHFYLNDSTVIREMLILARARITLSTKVQKKIRLDFQPSNECRLSRHSGNAVKAVRWCWCTQHQPHNSYLSDGIVLTELGLVPNLLMRTKVEQAGWRERFLFRKQQWDDMWKPGWNRLSQAAGTRNVSKF